MARLLRDEKLQELFNELDEDRSGSITKAEMAELVKVLPMLRALDTSQAHLHAHLPCTPLMHTSNAHLPRFFPCAARWSRST